MKLAGEPEIGEDTIVAQGATITVAPVRQRRCTLSASATSPPHLRPGERPYKDVRAGIYRRQKRCAMDGMPSHEMAEREGFEPPEGCPSTVFKTAALNRSATSPNKRESTSRFHASGFAIEAFRPWKNTVLPAGALPTPCMLLDQQALIQSFSITGRSCRSK